MRRTFPLLRMVLALAVLSGCGPGIPNGRYGVESVRFRGASQMDDQSIAACLGTRMRPTFRVDIGLRGAPECGEPPFDGDHLIVDFWSWPWEEWPLFDESVFERDVSRIERWYRARGFYEARVTATEVVPPTASRIDHSVTTCGAGPGSDCSVDVTFSVEEGRPSVVTRVSMRGIRQLEPGMREQLRSVLQIRSGMRFDEALYEDTKRRMQRVLLDAGFADAHVGGEVKVNPQRHEVFVSFEIDAGAHGVIGRVCISGYATTERFERGGRDFVRHTRHLPPQPMLDVAALDPGAPFSLRTLEESQRALYALGVLSGVEIVPQRRVRDDPSEMSQARGPEPERHLERIEVPPGHERQLCQPGPSRVPAGHRPVDIFIRVTPGRVETGGVGAGVQIGQAVTFGTVTTFAEQQEAAQWDVHLSGIYEHRNLFDRLIRMHLEVRPRLIFDWGGFNPAEPTPIGVQVGASFRWPAFIESRTNLLLTLREDLGPMPFTGFYRSDTEASIGLERTFLDGRLYVSLPIVRGNWFVPTDQQPIDPRDRLPQLGSLWVEEVARLDLRDDARNPTAGAYFAVTSQQAIQPLGSWDFLRVTGEARGYIPLPFGIVLAGRFEIGIMEIFGFNRDQLDPQNVYQFAQLGPPTLQLYGGGASSNRGYLPGLLGDAEQVYVTRPRDPRDVVAGRPIESRPVRISAGTWLWEASLEVRIPITLDFGLVLFGDAGDVDRDRLDDPNDQEAFFRFDHPQFTFGAGLRYRTIIGPVRLDVGVRPDELQVWGQNSLPPPCTTNAANHCRPTNRFDFLGLFSFPGAFHLTIGEAF